MDRWTFLFLNCRFLQSVYRARGNIKDSIKPHSVSLSNSLYLHLPFRELFLNGSLWQEQSAFFFFFFFAVNALRGQTAEWTEQTHLWHAGIWKPATRQRVSPLFHMGETLSDHGWPPGFSGSTSACLPSSHTHTHAHTDVDAGGGWIKQTWQPWPFPGPVGSAVQVSQQSSTSSAERTQCCPCT